MLADDKVIEIIGMADGECGEDCRVVSSLRH